MKKITLSIIASLMSGSMMLTSCDDFLTKTPPTQLSVEGYWNSELNAKSWLAGTYSELQQALGQHFFFWGEARSDNFFPTQYETGGLPYNALLSSESYASWTNLYRVIGSCNIGLDNIDKVDGNKETLNSMKGQWHGLRALMYFYAIRVWGDVPLIISAWDGNTDTKFRERTPVAEVCKQIEEDIESAVGLLDNEGVFYFNKGAALALKTDYCMWVKDYEGALRAVDELLSSKRYFLASGADGWKKAMVEPATNDGESIFNLYWNYEKNGRQPFGGNVGLNGQSHYQTSESCLQNMLNDKEDVRFWAVVDTAYAYNSSFNNKLTLEKGVTHVNFGSSTAIFHKLTKFLKITKVNGSAVEFDDLASGGFEGKIPLLRTADMLLLKAEALNKLDRPQEAIDIVNSIRKRAGNRIEAKLEDYPVRDGYSDLRSRERLILDERQMELYGEGKRWFDLRRTGYVKDALDEHLKFLQRAAGYEVVGFEIGVSSGEGRLLFPLSQSVFTSNPILHGKQNEPYSE